MFATTTSRGPLGLVAAVLAGGVSAAVVIAASRFNVTGLLYLTALPIYLVGLGAGAMAGLTATVVATLAMLFISHTTAAFYLIFCGVPTVTLIRIALHRTKTGACSSPGQLLAAMTLYPALLFVLAAASASASGSTLLAETKQALAQIATAYAAKFGEDQAELFNNMVAMVSAVVPAFAAYIWIFMTMAGIAVAHYALRSQKLNLRDSFSVSSVTVPTPLIYAVAATGVAGVLAPAPYDYIGLNLALMFGLPFFFVGLAVIHAAAATARYQIVLLLAFYVLLLFLPGIALLVAAFGVVDQWVNFRQRLAERNKQIM